MFSRSPLQAIPFVAFIFAIQGVWTVQLRADDIPAKSPRPQIAAPATPEGPDISLTLPDAVALALRDNRAIKSAYLQRIIQKFDLRVAEDKFSPRLTLSSSALARRTNGINSNGGDFTPIISMTTPIGTQIALIASNTYTNQQGGPFATSSSINLGVIQPLLRDAGQDIATASVRAARLDEQINRLKLKQTVSGTVSEVILTYRSFLKAQEQLRITRESLKRSRSLLDVNRSLIQSGRMAEVEIVQTEANVAAQEYAVEEASNQLDSARLALLSTLAVSPRTSIITADTLEAGEMHVDVEKALAIAFDNQPDYLTQLLSIERAKIALAVAQNQRQWDLSVVAGANLGRTRLTARKEQDRGTYGGLQLTVPLGDLSLEQAEVNAKVTQKNAELQREVLHQQVEQNVRDAVRNVHIRWRQLDLARKSRILARKKIDIENEKLRAGRSSNFQVLSFENDLQSAENSYLSSLISYLDSLTILDQQLGTTLDTWQIAINDD